MSSGWLLAGPRTSAKAKVLRGRDILIWYDNDASGQKGALLAEDILRSTGAKTVIAMSPSPHKPHGFDLADGVYEEYWESLQ
jgi:hypothetical protein